jgi:hypothetical protein
MSENKKFNLGDGVFFMKNDVIMKGKVAGITEYFDVDEALIGRGYNNATQIIKSRLESGRIKKEYSVLFEIERGKVTTEGFHIDWLFDNIQELLEKLEDHFRAGETE